MKKNIVIACCSVVIVLFCSCKNEVENVFDRSATERYNDWIAECKSTLIAGQSWWKFDYTTPTDYKTIFFLKFFEDGSINLIDLKNSSVLYSFNYAFNRAQGPILVLAATGGNPLVDLAAHQSQKGDIEFIIMDIKTDSISLKGRKNQDKVALTRVSGSQPADFVPSPPIER
jgi:hypothetical protein